MALPAAPAAPCVAEYRWWGKWERRLPLYLAVPAKLTDEINLAKEEEEKEEEEEEES
jgi:hypothetical protein